MVTVRSVVQWTLGGIVALLSLTALTTIELSIVSVPQGVTAALLFFCAAILIVPRTRSIVTRQNGLSFSTGILVGIVVVGVVTGMAVSPIEPDDEPKINSEIDSFGDGNDTDDADEDSTDETTDSDSDARSEGTEVNGELEIHHIDVGQADSTLIVTPEGETVLIDTGDWRQDGSAVIAYLEAEGIDRVDHLVTTHGHADHIGGHAAVIEHFETRGDGIGAIYDPGVTHDSATYENYLDAIDEHDVDLFEVAEGDNIPIDGVDATALNPPSGDSGDDVDHNSIVIAFEFGEFTYLTTGDIEDRAEQRLVAEWRGDLAADAYQAGHHGSATSSTRLFTEAVDPKIAVISSDYDSRYGHPDDEVLERFADMGIETYWTGVHGDVVLMTDGTTIDVETASDFSTDADDIREERPDSEERASFGAPRRVDTTAKAHAD